MLRTTFALFSLAAISVGDAMAASPPAPDAEIDLIAAAPAQARILLENDRVRVVEYHLAPGEKDDWHTHPAKISYVVSGGDLRIFLADGTSFDVTEKDDDTVWSEPVGRHYVENIGKTPIKIILVEVKEAQ